jgi:hypothetical protein
VTVSDGADRALGERTVVERPPPGLARGRYPVPAWTVALLGALVVLVGLAYLVRRFFERAKR